MSMEAFLDDVIAFGAANWIALGAFVVAILSAVYSRWSVDEARRANRIAIHEFHREFYEAFDELDHKIYYRAPNLDREDVKAFSTYARLASVYLPKDLAKQTSRFRDTYLELIICNEDIASKEQAIRTGSIRTDYVRAAKPDDVYQREEAELKGQIAKAEGLRDSLSKRLRVEATELDAGLVKNMRISD